MERLATAALTLFMLVLIGCSINLGLKAHKAGQMVTSCARWLTVEAPCAQHPCAVSATGATGEIRVTAWRKGRGEAALTHTGPFDERLLACTPASPCYGQVREVKVFGQPQRTLALNVNGAPTGRVVYYYRPRADRGRFSADATSR